MGNIWSTDAPYREDMIYLNQLRMENAVVAVDMEYSALCAICCFRKVDFAAVFLVSDELFGKDWNPGFSSQLFKEKSKILLPSLLHFPFQEK